MASGVKIVGDGDERARSLSRMRCWGDFALCDPASGADLKPRGRKARALLAYLALHPGRTVSRERLVGLLWGDRAEEQARASLRQSLLELKGLTNGARGLLRVERDEVALDPEALRTDVDELHECVASGDFERLLEVLPDPDERLFANLEGLDSGFDDWLMIERARRREELVTLIADAAASAAARGKAREARALRARLREWGGEAPPFAPAEALPAAAVEDSPRSPTARRLVALLLAILLAAAIIAIGGWQLRRDEPASPARIAVLPFKDLSGRGDAHFAEGVSEEILGQLARNPNFRVTGRTSAWSFKDEQVDARRWDADSTSIIWSKAAFAAPAMLFE